MIAALLACATLAPAGGEIDELIERSRSIRAFDATFEMRKNDELRGRMRFALRATESARMDITSSDPDEGSLSVVVSGGAISVSSYCEDSPRLLRIDLVSLMTEFEPIERAYRSCAPQAPAPLFSLAPCIAANWSYDETAQKASIPFTADVVLGFETPLGWLTTLRKKGATGVPDGEVLRYQTDGGTFEIAVDRGNGMLVEFRAIGKKGILLLTRTALDLDPDPKTETFAHPTGPTDASEATAIMRRGVKGQIQWRYRRCLYERLATSALPAGQEGARTKLAAVLRAYHELDEPYTSEKWRRENAKTICEGGVKRLRELAAAGKTPEEVEAARQREIDHLSEQLDDLEQRSVERLKAPDVGKPPPGADELLALEKEVFVDVFTRLVREPVMREFDEAISGER